MWHRERGDMLDLVERIARNPRRMRQRRHDEGKGESGPEGPGRQPAHAGRGMPEGGAWGDCEVIEASGAFNAIWLSSSWYSNRIVNGVNDLQRVHNAVLGILGKPSAYK